MSKLGSIDNLLPFGGTCTLCGRYFDINEVYLGVFVEYFLHKKDDCTCPTCFGEQLHRVQDPSVENVLESQKYCDRRPSDLILAASTWRKPGRDHN
jgi:hypothetical protein